MITLGILREEKVPQDNRVPLSPEQAAVLKSENLNIAIQPSAHRCFTDEEYRAAGIELKEDLKDCNAILAVKEIPKENFIEGMTYFFFSHTIKGQDYNMPLLQEALNKNIRLIDWECLTNATGARIIAFGRWAGIVGGHNALWTYGKRTGKYDLKRAVQCKDHEELVSLYKGMNWPPFKIVVTGLGRVAKGVIETLDAAGIKHVSQEGFLKTNFSEAVYTVVDSEDLYRRDSDEGFEQAEFFTHGDRYHSIFKPYTHQADIMINGIYWDPKSPSFFTLEEMKDPEFRIKVIADITCDIAPVSSIPSTLKATTIADPVFGFDPLSGQECNPYDPKCIDVMSIDNLPNELPRDASIAFGEMFMQSVLPEALKPETSEVLQRATIVRNGELNQIYSYLKEYLP